MRWLIKHRAGIVGTIAFHFLVLMIFSLATVRDYSDTRQAEITMDFTEQEILPDENEQRPDEQTAKNPSSNRAKNTAYDPREASRIYEQEQQQINQSVEERIQQEIDEELKQLEEEVIAEQRASGYGYTEAEAEALIESMKSEELNQVEEKQVQSVEPSKFEGETNITYKLDNRYDQRIDVTVYLCAKAGVVTVNIAVDQQGRVVAAQVDERQSAKHECLRKAALRGANNARFNANSKAPSLQKGSMTFTFVAQ